MKKVLLFGAIDRFNYGDLLLPIIIKSKLTVLDNSNKLDFSVYGTIKSDLRRYGAYPTKSLSEFYEACKQDNTTVIIVGGEVLSARWSNIYSYLSPIYNKFYRLTTSVLRRYSISLNDTIAKTLMKGQGKSPFVLDKDALRIRGKVIYNGVGGARGSSFSKDILRILSDADYLSCRDIDVYHNLVTVNNRVLVPDSAILMSTLFSKDHLRSLLSEGNLLPNEPYLFFQISNREANFLGLENIIKKLYNTARLRKMKIVLCPIGTALGHEDQVPLSLINKQLKGMPHIYIENPTIWDIMCLIAHSALYIGSSLHGVITAMSFEVPHLVIRESSKISSYLKTWGIDGLKDITNMLNWETNIDMALSIDENTLVACKEKQIMIAEKSIADIYNSFI